MLEKGRVRDRNRAKYLGFAGKNKRKIGSGLAKAAKQRKAARASLPTMQLILHLERVQKQKRRCEEEYRRNSDKISNRGQ